MAPAPLRGVRTRARCGPRRTAQVANFAVVRFDDEEVVILVAVPGLHEQDKATVSTPTVPGDDRPAAQSVAGCAPPNNAVCDVR
jgi:hypothetical protein